MRGGGLVLAAALILGLSLACSGGEAPRPEPKPEPKPEIPKPPKPLKGNLQRIEVPVGAQRRTVLLHVPDKDGKGWSAQMPLVVAFHDRDSDPKKMAENFSRWFDQGVMFAFPSAKDPANPGQGWHVRGKDAAIDVEFAESLVDQIDRKYKVADGRAFATGFGNGAALTWVLACELQDTFDGFAPVSAGLPRRLQEACPSDGDPLLVIAGTDDQIALWTGQNDALPVPDSVDLWVTKNGCDKASARKAPPADPVADDKSSVIRHDWTCPGPAVSLLEISGGGHFWPRPDAIGSGANRDIDAAEELLRFFQIGL